MKSIILRIFLADRPKIVYPYRPMNVLRRFYETLRNRHHSGIFRQIPLHTPGRLYVSPMPFGAYDRGNRLLKLYTRFKIHHVIMLVTDEELAKKARRNLKQRYKKNGITFSQYPFIDLQAPSFDIINDLVQEAVDRLSHQNVAVHCHAGVGRTGVVACCIVRAVENWPTAKTLDYVKTHMSVDMTTSQTAIVEAFDTKLYSL